jgi:hypothetical protein
MPARGVHSENREQKQSFITDTIHPPSTSPAPFATELDHPPALSAFNSPTLVTHHLSDTETEDAKVTGGKVQEDLEFNAPPLPRPLPVQISTPLHRKPESQTPATATGHTRAPVVVR